MFRLPCSTLCSVALVALTAGALTTPASASPAAGGIGPSLIQELQETQLAGSEKALADIVANSDIREIALNRERFLEHSPLVNHRIKTGSITHQKSSGRC